MSRHDNVAGVPPRGGWAGVKPEPRFRAWDEKARTMHFDDIGGIGTHGDVFLSSIGYFPGVLMLVTGMFDTLGKPIYEGDIVRYGYEKENPDWFTMVVEYTSGYEHECGYGYSTHIVGFVLRGWDNVTGEWWYTDWPGNARRIEVVGNLYENPRMLLTWRGADEEA